MPLFKYSFKAVIFSIVFFMLYASLGTFLVYRNFEKTQSTEVFFFSGFLISCMTESLRLLIPLFGLWQSFSPLFVFTGRAIFFGRLLCPLSFLFSSIMNIPEQHMDIERNYTIMLVISIVFAAVIPLNTVTPSGLCTLHWGYSRLFMLIRIVFFLITITSMFINAYQRESTELFHSSFGFIIFMAGYIFLLEAGNYFNLMIGITLISAGSYEYLSKIHHLYLWK